MIVFVLSEKEGGTDIEKLGYSYENLNILDKKLSYYQENCLEFGDVVEKYKINNDDLTTVKKILESTSEDYSVFYYESCFFDFLFNDILNNHNKSGKVITNYCINNKLIFSLASNKKLKDVILNDYNCQTVFEYLTNNSESETPDFYYIFLDTYNSYKRLNFDIINNKTNVFLPSIAKGVFTDGKLPRGDYTLIPPVYISEKSQIEKGAIIGPSTVISKNTLIACDSRISNSILCENTFVSNDCLIDDSICGMNCSVKRGAAVLSECVLGYDSVVGDDMFIESGDIVFPETKINNINPLYKNSINIEFENGCFKNLNVVTACKLGCAFGKTFNGPPVCIGNDNNMLSSTVKLAFVSGLCSSGCDCFDIGSSFLNKLFYTSFFCKLKYGFFFTCEEKTVVLKIFNENCDTLKNSEIFNLIHSYKNFNTIKLISEEIKKVKQIKGIGKLYIRDLKNLLPEKLSKKYMVSCDNPSVKKAIENVFKLKQSVGNAVSSIRFIINDSGTELSCELNNKCYNHLTLCDVFKKLESFAFDNELVSFSYKKDALVLLFGIISYIETNNVNLKKIENLLKQYSLVERVVPYSDRTGKVVSNLLFNARSEYKKGKLYINYNDESIFFKINPVSKNLRLVAKCFNAESSQEMSKEIDALIEDIKNL